LESTLGHVPELQSPTQQVVEPPQDAPAPAQLERPPAPGLSVSGARSGGGGSVEETQFTPPVAGSTDADPLRQETLFPDAPSSALFGASSGPGGPHDPQWHFCPVGQANSLTQVCKQGFPL